MDSQSHYDVIVVGSGAAGGIAAYVLATKGLNVLCLEAGRTIDSGEDFHPHKMPYDWTYRGHGKPGQYGKLPQGMGWKITEWTDHLYTIPQEDPYALAPGSKFTWTRLRAVGGRTNVWGRSCDRFGPLDFKPKSLQDGWGDDWPVTYDDVAPYYDHVEKLIGVSGLSEGVDNTPCGKNLLPAFRPRCGEWLIKHGAEKLGIKVLPLQLAVLSQNYDGRPECHYCGACNNGCDTASRFSSPDVLVPKLEKLKNFTLRPNSVVHTVLLDKDTGKARGVTYIDAHNGQEYEAFATAVVLGASMVESIRILFNSRDRNSPQGLANSSGLLGKYLMEHVAFNDIPAFFPQLVGRPVTNDDGPGEASLYIPRYYYRQGSEEVPARLPPAILGRDAARGPGTAPRSRDSAPLTRNASRNSTRRTSPSAGMERGWRSRGTTLKSIPAGSRTVTAFPKCVSTPTPNMTTPSPSAILCTTRWREY